jgi:hypothetical protein
VELKCNLCGQVQLHSLLPVYAQPLLLTDCVAYELYHLPLFILVEFLVMSHDADVPVDSSTAITLALAWTKWHLSSRHGTSCGCASIV